MVAVLFGLGSLVFALQEHSVSPALGDEFLVGVGMLGHFFNFPDAIPGVGRVIIGSPFGQFLFVLHIGWILEIHLLQKLAYFAEKQQRRGGVQKFTVVYVIRACERVYPALVIMNAVLFLREV